MIALEGMTWNTLEHLFLEKYFPEHAYNAKRVKILSLQQGDLSVADFEARFALDITSNDATKARKFE